MKTKNSPQIDRDLVAGAGRALRRAAVAARRLAERTSTPCYVVKDGRIVDITKKSKRRHARQAVTARG